MKLIESFYEIDEPEFARVSAIFDSLEYQLAVGSVLGGETTGSVWVDDPLNPRSALLQAGHRFHFAGETQNSAFVASLQTFFKETIVPHRKAAGYNGFSAYYADGWKEVIAEQILLDCQLYPGDRQYYEIEIEPGSVWQVPVFEEKFTIAAVDQNLVERSDLGCREDLVEEMLSERVSVEDFVSRSFGVCLLHEASVAGWCLSEYNLDDRCEIGIATAEPFRRKGLAVAQGLAFLNMAVARGMRRVGWHCWSNNTGSWSAALRLGLKKKVDYHSFYVDYSGKPSL